MERRPFLKSLAAMATVPWIMKGSTPKTGILTLLHTNDTHSRIEPFGPGNDRWTNKGGVARRTTLLKQIRAACPSVLLLDAGDVFQGTPYFNMFKGKLEYKLMSHMGYDVATIGNHDFDNGVEAWLEASQEANFPFVVCNFGTKGAPEFAKRIQPYVIKEFPGLKVGITGVGVSFRGLVAPKNHAGVTWIEPPSALKPIVQTLREKEKVDMVVVLSHLGYDNKGEYIDDKNLAWLVPGIDVIVGGHSHTFLERPDKMINTWINQVGWAGIHLGRMDFQKENKEIALVGAESLEVASLPGLSLV